MRQRKATNLEKYGCDYHFQNPEVKEKIKATNIKHLGCEYPGQNAEVKEKIKATNLKNLGYEYSSQNPEVKEKVKATNIKNLGCENPAQNAEVKEKMKATNIKNLGCEYPMQNEEVKEKSKTTCFQKYGYECPLQNADVKEKSKVTCLNIYGSEIPMQNSEVFKRSQNTAFKRKLFTFASGVEIYIQGYEAFALDLLITQGVKEEDLLLGFDTMPRIMYESDGKIHRYYPDIFIPSQSKIVEVKSEYTYDTHRDVTHLKIQACHVAGFNAEIWIFSGKGELLRVVSDHLFETGTQQERDENNVSAEFN